MSQENVEALRALYALWAQGNFRDGSELFSPDVEFDPLPDREVARGLAAVAEYMRDFLAHWSEFRVEAVELLPVGDRVVVQERQRGRGKAGRVETEATFYAVWTFSEGLARHVRWVARREEALEAARSRM